MNFWCFRRILRISHMFHLSNDRVLLQMTKDKEVFGMIKKRKMFYFEQILIHKKYETPQLLKHGKIASKRGPGRSTFWFKNLRHWAGVSLAELFTPAVNRVVWIGMIVIIQLRIWEHTKNEKIHNPWWKGELTSGIV